MADDEQPLSEQEGTETAPEAQEASPPARTPEQVEAEWSARHSAAGRQHAATEKALRDQIAALQAAKAPSSGDGDGQDAIRAEIERLTKELADERVARALEVRAARYPYSAEALEPSALAAMDEARLAGLEARLTPTASPRITSSTPPRSVDSAPKPLHEKTADELRADLARFAPDFARTLRDS